MHPKRCASCGETKPAEDFFWSPARLAGSGYCKACDRERQRARRARLATQDGTGPREPDVARARREAEAERIQAELERAILGQALRDAEQAAAEAGSAPEKAAAVRASVDADRAAEEAAARARRGCPASPGFAVYDLPCCQVRYTDPPSHSAACPIAPRAPIPPGRRESPARTG
ncbi:MAG: hypothetical protein ACLQDY_12820 [Streptosporangiaceae bacterium]